MAFKIESLYIYPVKSLAGIRVDEAKVLQEGFMHDRRWMLVDNNGTFISQRKIPLLALFDCQLEDEYLTIVFKNDQIRIPLSPPTNPYTDVTVWDSHFKAQKASIEASEWFSDLLHTSVSLVFYGNNSNRKKEFTTPPFSSKVSFADGYPYLLLGSASMDLLNSKLVSPVHLNRFRPNIYIKTEIPHEEDNLSECEVSTVKFKNIKPCVRCIMTTVNQETGELGKEPLKTLSTYRNATNKIYFGTNLIALNNGIVSVGDLLTIS